MVLSLDGGIVVRSWCPGGGSAAQEWSTNDVDSLSKQQPSSNPGKSSSNPRLKAALASTYLDYPNLEDIFGPMQFPCCGATGEQILKEA
jgi:hypothetical protein